MKTLSREQWGTVYCELGNYVLSLNDSISLCKATKLEFQTQFLEKKRKEILEIMKIIEPNT